jgi:Ca2+-binding RTX toxin-like protein
MSSLQLLIGTQARTPQVINRAIATLYSNLGNNLDERDWTSILAAADPLAAAEAALTAQYQDANYLLRNANQLLARGYTESQITLTYQQLATRGGFSYSPAWANGTAFAPAASAGGAAVLAQAASDQQQNLPAPTLGFSAGADGFTITASEEGLLRMSVSGSLGNVFVGPTVLSTARAAVVQGTLTLRGGYSQKTSTTGTQFVVLGTNGNNSISTNGGGNRADFIDGGSGNDAILAGDGNDYVLGGAGNDTLFGGNGNDTLTGGSGTDLIWGDSGDDVLIAGIGWDTLRGGGGTDTLYLNAGALEQEVVQLDISSASLDDADIIDGFHFGGGLGGNGFDRLDLTIDNDIDLIGAAGSLSSNANDGNGTTIHAYPADTAPDPGGFDVHTLYVIAGVDQLGAGTTMLDAETRAREQLNDGVDFLANTTGTNQGALVLLTDDGTNHFLFLVVDANNDQETSVGEVTLIAQFVNSTNIGGITMVDFAV